MKHKPMKSINFRKLFPKGSVLVFSLLILSIMLVTSLTILSSAVLDRKASLSTGSSARSFQVADSGVEEVLYQIYKGNHATLEDMRSAIGGGATCANGVIKFPVAGGDATVTFYQGETTVYAGTCAAGTDWRDKVVKIKSEGTAGTTTRAVEVAVAAAGLGSRAGINVNQTYQAASDGVVTFYAYGGTAGDDEMYLHVSNSSISDCSGTGNLITRSFGYNGSSSPVKNGEYYRVCHDDNGNGGNGSASFISLL